MLTITINDVNYEYKEDYLNLVYLDLIIREQLENEMKCVKDALDLEKLKKQFKQPMFIIEKKIIQGQIDKIESRLSTDVLTRYVSTTKDIVSKYKEKVSTHREPIFLEKKTHIRNKKSLYGGTRNVFLF